jgi:uncharacterized protein with beta-barrel porin domain
MNFRVPRGAERPSRRVLLATASLLWAAAIVAPPASAQTTTFNFTGAAQSFNVLTTGSYRITVAGAQGGNGTPSQPLQAGGAGAVITGAYTFTAGEVLNIIVGGQGDSATGFGAGGGGGGSFVFDTTSNQLIVAAGGGGGGGAQRAGALGGQLTTAGSWGGGAGAGQGGDNGAGGQANPNDHGGGGGGFLTAGQNSSNANGGGSYFSPAGGTSLYGKAGGFGGGGGASSYEGGGGGGYSRGGGGSGVYHYGGGGGGSFEASGFSLLSAVGGSSGDAATFTGNGGNGYIYLTLLQAALAAGGTYSASGLGASLLPAFRGGALKIDVAGQTYGQAFTVDGSPSNTIDQNGKAVTFSGVFSDASSAGAITIANSAAGGGVTFTAANTYTGPTTIDPGASLALSGAGAVASSSGVLDNGVFDVSAVAGGHASIARLSGSGQVNLGAADLTLSGAADTFSGSLSGVGGLTLAGGTETLSGTSVVGSTTVAGGTLIVTGTLAGAFAINNGGTLRGSTANLLAQGAVNDNGALVFDQPTDGTFANAIAGSGALTKQGAGLLVLNGASALSQTTVSAGNLQIGDISHPQAQLASAVAVSPGATLSGHGAVIGAVTNEGTVSPGGSIGVLTITGDYTQSPTATLSIELNPQTSSSLAVSGRASLAGNLVLLATGGVYRAGKTYTLVSAGAVSGGFSQVSLSNGLPFTLTNTGTAELLTLTEGLFPTAGGTANQAAAGLAYVSVPVGHADFDKVAEALTSLPGAAQLQAAAEQTGGEIAADTGWFGRQATRRLMTALADQMFDAALSGGGGGAWGRGFGGQGTVKGDGNAHGVATDGGGALLGGAMEFGPSGLLGATVGFDEVDASLQGLSQSAASRALTLGAYGERRLGVLFLDAAASVGVLHGDTRRTIAFSSVRRTADGAFTGVFAGQLVSAGARWRGPGGLTIEPSVALVASEARRNAYEETDAGDLGLQVAGRNDNAAQVQAGVRFAAPIALPGGSRLSLQGHAAWIDDLSDAAPTTRQAYAVNPAGGFTLTGADPGARATVIGGGLAYQASRRLSVSARYDRTFGEHADGMQVSAGVRWAW